MVGASQMRLWGCLGISENSASARSLPSLRSISPLQPESETSPKQKATAILRAVVGIQTLLHAPLRRSSSKRHATTGPSAKCICRHFEYRKNRFGFLDLDMR